MPVDYSIALALGATLIGYVVFVFTSRQFNPLICPRQGIRAHSWHIGAALGIGVGALLLSIVAVMTLKLLLAVFCALTFGAIAAFSVRWHWRRSQGLPMWDKVVISDERLDSVPQSVRDIITAPRDSAGDN